MKYTKFLYLYPPRPTQTTHFSTLSKYDDGNFIAQPKYNGTCCVVFMNETELIVMNRHNGTITSNYTKIDFRGMYKGIGASGWIVLCGEMLNKNKKGEDGKPFNLKFVIWDILVWNGEYLLKSTFVGRMNMLEKLFPCVKMKVGDSFQSMKHICFTNYENIYKAPCYDRNFLALYKSIVDTDLYEGLVIKRAEAKLTYGLTEKNNNDWQIKCRKSTLNYDF